MYSNSGPVYVKSFNLREKLYRDNYVCAKFNFLYSYIYFIAVPQSVLEKNDKMWENVPSKKIKSENYALSE